MGDLLLPPRVRREIQKEKWAEQRAERRAAIRRLLDFDDPVCREWNPVVRKLDPLLSLARARPQAYEPGLHVRPGFYHWVRDNETADMTVEPITGPDGDSFAEPDSSLLDALRSNDLQNPRVWAALIEHRANAEAEREREHRREMDELNENIYERWLAGNRAFVSMDRSAPWTQSAKGRREK